MDWRKREFGLGLMSKYGLLDDNLKVGDEVLFIPGHKLNNTTADIHCDHMPAGPGSSTEPVWLTSRRLWMFGVEHSQLVTSVNRNRKLVADIQGCKGRK